MELDWPGHASWRHAAYDRRGDAMDRAALPRPDRSARPDRRRRRDLFFTVLQVDDQVPAAN